jgi:hypothetical protein
MGTLKTGPTGGVMNRPDGDHPIDDDAFAPAARDPEAPLDEVDEPALPTGDLEANEADAIEQAQIVMVDDYDESPG